ncbi:MAG: bifunctional riboflavin kinase/FAD synthetase, partial [Dichotomicrobium sp.]
MEIVQEWRDRPAATRNAVMAIGNFDGVHRGHQALLERACTLAREQGRPAGVMVFEPHPRTFFQPDRAFFELTPLPRKLHLMELFGIDVASVVRFDAALAGLTAEAFVQEVLVDGLGIAHAVVGYNFFFGKGRGGNPAVLQELGARAGFGVDVVEAVGGAGEAFSSTRAREALAEGDPRGAADVLGYWWRVVGEVTGGAGRGRNLGFPTANITLAENQVLRHGIYAVRVHVDGAIRHGAAYLGTRPTFDDGPAVLETFLLDYDGDLYGKRLEVEFIEYIRDDARFPDADSLVDQMRIDCEKAAQILSD